MIENQTKKGFHDRLLRRYMGGNPKTLRGAKAHLGQPEYTVALAASRPDGKTGMAGQAITYLLHPIGWLPGQASMYFRSPLGYPPGLWFPTMYFPM